MFNKLKQYKDLRSQAKTLQAMLAQESVTIEKDGVTLVMDGNQKVTSLQIAATLEHSQLETILPAVFNQAVAKVQQLVVQKMQQSGVSLPGM